VTLHKTSDKSNGSYFFDYSDWQKI